MSRACLAFLFLAGCVCAQPLLYYRGALNSASYMPQGLPGGGIAQGSIFSVFGSGLGPSQGVQQPGFPLSNSLGGASLTITQGSTVVNAIPVYVSSGLINAIMPSNAPLGAASMQATVNGQTSNPLPVDIVKSSFGIYAANSAGLGPGILQNYTPAGLPINSPTITAAPNQTIIMWGTGLGPVQGGDNVAPTVVNLPAQVEVFVGGQSAQVSYSGRTPCCSGVDQINFVVPPNAPQGCWVPVYVRTGGKTVSNVVTMAIQNNGGACSDAANPFASVVVSGGNAGGFVAVRATTHEDVGTTAPVDVATDIQASTFYSQPAAAFPFNSALSMPPPGTCTEFTVKGDLLNGDPLPDLALTGNALNAGPPITLTGSNVQVPVNLTAPTDFGQFLLGYFGGSIGGSTISGTPSLNPGTYTVTGSGGNDVGKFQANLNVPAPITWTGRDSLQSVDRSQPLTISWSGEGSADHVSIVGFGEDLPSNASTMFVCRATPGASSLTVPPSVLANLPVTRANPLQSKDVLYLISVPGSAGTTITPSGLNAGAAMFLYINGKTVTFQ